MKKFRGVLLAVIRSTARVSMNGWLQESRYMRFTGTFISGTSDAHQQYDDA